MKISTKGRYALRLMLDVALHSHGTAVPLRDVAHRQDISDKYLEQIVTQLSRAGLVRSVRGAGGGYLLTREPEEYTVGEILRVLEGNLAPVSCAAADDVCRCGIRGGGSCDPGRSGPPASGEVSGELRKRRLSSYVKGSLRDKSEGPAYPVDEVSGYAGYWKEHHDAAGEKGHDPGGTGASSICYPTDGV